jgi:hypothetical protein
MKHAIVEILNKRYGQSKIDNSETQATLGTKHRTETNKNYNYEH